MKLCRTERGSFGIKVVRLHDKVSDLEFQNMLLRENFKLRNKRDFDPYQEQEIKMKNY